jgi:DNA polymerase-3 subunit epsilon
VHYYDQNGFGRLAVKKMRTKREAAIPVKNVLEGQDLLRKLVSEFDLCLRLSGIPKSKEYCVETNCICCQTGKQQIAGYNQKAEEALQLLKESSFTEPALIHN